MRRFLLASHGTPGAIVAEEAVLTACNPQDEIHHLYVIPSWWTEMTGDDWLNNGVSRNRFRNHLESELREESNETIYRVQQKCKMKRISYKLHLIVGNSEISLREMVSKGLYEKVFLGESRPKHVEGLNDRMLTRKNRSLLEKALTVIPHPNG